MIYIIRLFAKFVIIIIIFTNDDTDSSLSYDFYIKMRKNGKI